MLAVVFEVEPHPQHRETYLALAGSLRPEAEAIDGFISVERFGFLERPGRLLSLSMWRDEEALATWRAHSRHRGAQRRGREVMFRDYRLRVGDEAAAETNRPFVTITTGRIDREEAQDWRRRAEDLFGALEAEACEALLTEGRHAILASWDDPFAATGFAGSLPADGVSHMQFEILRDYGPGRREEAPADAISLPGAPIQETAP